MIIDAVIPGFEYFVPITAKVNEYLHLPGMGYQEASQVRHKDLMRITLHKSRTLQPRFCLVNSFHFILQFYV